MCRKKPRETQNEQRRGEPGPENSVEVALEGKGGEKGVGQIIWEKSYF